MPTKLPYEDKLGPDKAEFLKKLNEICAILSIRPEWVMVVFAIESARTFSPSIKNKYTNAVGLIQFMPTTAIELGTSIEELEKMTAVKQLDYVLKYFRPYRGRMKSFVDVYLAVFFPAAIGKPDDYMFGLTASMQKRIAQVNPGYDINKDMIIQKKEVKEVISMFIPAEWKTAFNS